MEIYLDANATTPVLPQAREAALAVMGPLFGNPSSVHGSGLQARVVLDRARAAATRVLGASNGRVIFTSGATEGIQTAVLSSLLSLRQALAQGMSTATTVLYGATEHKAVPEAIKHWRTVLALDLEILAIPVGGDGRHDLEWLKRHLPNAGLVCTMAANNETGVVTDLDAIEKLMQGSQALWLVDGVQALGKIDLQLAARRIDYAPFSGHKLYAPKGIGMLYVRDGAPYTPLIAGGGQESALRSGTENMSGIAALGTVLEALESKEVFASHREMSERRQRLADALMEAFPGVVLNVPFDKSLPTTLNFSVPDVSSKVLLDLFDAAGIRVSGGSACGASKAAPSYVLQAMGLAEWQTSSAVRLSFGAADSAAMIEEACRLIRICGEALRSACQSLVASDRPTAPQRISRFIVDGACCYVIADVSSSQCMVIDPLPQLTNSLVSWISCRGYRLLGVLDTHSHGDHKSSADELRQAARDLLADGAPTRLDGLGWPMGTEKFQLGDKWLTRVGLPGHTRDSTAYMLYEAGAQVAIFCGDTVLPGALGRSDFTQSAPEMFGASLQRLAQSGGMDALLLPGHDYDNLFATTLQVEVQVQPLLSHLLSGAITPSAFAAQKAVLEQDIPMTEYQTVACGAKVDCTQSESVECSDEQIQRLLAQPTHSVIVDVREDYESQVGSIERLGAEAVALSSLVNALQRLRSLPAQTPVVFVCRSGNRSAQAARALRRLGHQEAWSLAGGIARWPSLTNVHSV